MTDVSLLVEYFLRSSPIIGDARRMFSAESLKRLEAYHWPGNVRELKHVVQRASILTDPAATELELPERFESPFGERESLQGLTIGRSIRDVERELIMRTLEHLNGDKKAAAETLGISLNTLYNRLNAYEGKGASS